MVGFRQAIQAASPPSTMTARTAPNIMIGRIPMPRPDRAANKTGKLSELYKRHERTVTQAEVVIIFLALIRTITACYQLQTGPGNVLPARQVEPIITGSLVAALFCLALTLLSFFGRQRVMHAIFALAIISLVLVKIFLFTG
jgi:hypothetical protein